MAAQVIAENIFTDDNMTHLLGAKNLRTGQIFFPMPLEARDDVEPVALAARGTIWTYTVQRFPPKEPYAGPTDRDKFKPYIVAYVELPGQTILESRITGIDPADVKIGMEVELTAVPLDPDAPADEQRLIHAFRPV